MHIPPRLQQVCSDLAELINFAALEYWHPNLVSYIKAYYDTDTFTILTEKIPLTLDELLLNTEKDLKTFIKQIIQAT